MEWIANISCLAELIPPSCILQEGGINSQTGFAL